VAEAEDYQQKVQAMLPHLQTLDNKRLNSARRPRHATEAAARKPPHMVKAPAAQEREYKAQPREVEGKGARQERNMSPSRLQPAEGVWEGRGGEGRAEAGSKRARPEETLPFHKSEADPGQKSGKKQKRKQRLDTRQAATTVQEEADVAQEARAQESLKPKKGRAAKKSRGVRGGDRQEGGTAVAPGGKQGKYFDASGEVAGKSLRDVAKASNDVEVAGIGVVEQPRALKGLKAVVELKAGMRGAEVGAALQFGESKAEFERPLAPAWD